MQDESSSNEINEKLEGYLAQHQEDRQSAFTIMHDAFHRMKIRNIPTLIMFMEATRLSQCLAIDLVRDYHNEFPSADAIMNAVLLKNEKDIAESMETHQTDHQ